MSDPDENVIEQLQAKRTRPRRQPPARRPPRAAPAPPQVANDARELAEPSPELEPNGTPTASAGTEQRALSAATDSATTPALPAPSETPKDRRDIEPDGADRSAVPERVATGSLRLKADEPTANYAVRVRRTLDDLVAWRLAELRRHGVRTSKVELTEMLLWELADASVENIVARLQDFRNHAPR